jgi:hypothetical protein
MNVEIGAEAALFPVKEYIKGIFVAVCYAMVKRQESFIDKNVLFVDFSRWRKQDIFGKCIILSQVS